MKTNPLLAVPLVLCLGACSKIAPPAPVEHPTPQEAQDFKDGEAFAQDKYNSANLPLSDVSAVTMYGSGFSQEGALINHSNYFNLGAYYKEYVIYENWYASYKDIYTGKVDNTTMQLAQTGEQVGWAGLADNFPKLGVSYDQFAKLAGKSPDELKTLVETSPDGQQASK